MPRRKGLPSEWTKHLSEEERKDFEELVRHSTTLLSRLKDIIDEKQRSLEISELNKENYADPSYPYWQAHVNGRKAGLQNIRALLEFLE